MANDHKMRTFFSDKERIDIYNRLIINNESVRDIANLYDCKVGSIYQAKRSDWYRKFQEKYPMGVPETEIKTLTTKSNVSIETGKIGATFSEQQRLDIFHRLVIKGESPKKVAERYQTSDASIRQAKRSNWFYKYKKLHNQNERIAM